MEDLLSVVMVIVAIASAIAKNKKKAEKAKKKTAAKAQPTLEQSLAEWFGEAKPAQPAKVEAKPAPQPAPKQVAQPTVKATVQVKEKPAVVRGSLQEDTHEGLHPCDEHDDEPMQGASPLVPIPVEKPGIQLDWSGENMVKAFIMQEVLTRPCDRRRRA